MLISRRRLLAGSCTIATAALIGSRSEVWAQPSQPQRLPLSQFMQDQRLVDAFRRGVQVMRSRPGSNPKSWFWQGAVHAFNDEIFAEAALADAGVAQVDQQKFWNQCPHFGQSSANFLIWHRAYLFYFERILRDAAQEPDLAVPYWNYDDPNQRGFPALFAPQFLDRERRVPNSLFHRNREAAFVTGRFDISATVAAAERAKAAPQFFSSPGTNGFGGDIREDGDTISGEIERRPHNDLHVAVGGVIGSNNGAMADVPTAAFDPVFWVHHANVDRMWREWAASPGKSWGPLPPASWFDEAPWTFVDADGTEKNLPRRFYLDADNLGIRFAGEPAGPGLRLPNNPNLFRGEARDDGDTTALFRHSAPMAVDIASAASTVAVAADRVAPTEDNRTRMLRPERGKQLIVRLSDITYDRLPSSGFKVFLAPRGAALDEDSPYFLGTLNLFSVRHGDGPTGHGGDHSGYQNFDGTMLLGRVGVEDLELQIVPYSLFANGGGEEPLRTEGVRIGQVSLLLSD